MKKLDSRHLWLSSLPVLWLSAFLPVFTFSNSNGVTDWKLGVTGSVVVLSLLPRAVRAYGFHPSYESFEELLYVGSCSALILGLLVSPLMIFSAKRSTHPKLMVFMAVGVTFEMLLSWLTVLIVSPTPGNVTLPGVWSVNCTLGLTILSLIKSIGEIEWPEDTRPWRSW